MAQEIERWRPWREMEERMDRLFEEAFGRPWRRLAPVEEAWLPAVELFEREGMLVLRAELPGMKREEITVEVADHTLTIAGERLELARIGMGTAAGPTLVLLASGLLASVVAALLWPTAGTPLLGMALLGLTGWLASHDVARHTLRNTGLPRYAASCLVAGYVWLAIAGAIWLVLSFRRPAASP